MLTNLKIKNVALIKELTIDFSGGLNVMTGETGAGKSIIIDALNFVLGGKPSKTLIRSGEKSMYVEAIFKGPFEHNILKTLKEFEIETEDELLITRNFGENSGTIKINGSTVTSTMLKSVTNTLVDIHGQHEHQSLLKNKNHINIIDNLDEMRVGAIKTRLEEIYKTYKSVLKEIESLGSNDETRERMIDLLAYQIKEIESVSLKENEDEELHEQRNKMLNGEKIALNLKGALDEIKGSYSSVGDNIRKAISFLNNITQYDGAYHDLIERLNGAKLELDDISGTLESFSEDNNFDETAFDKIDNRLDQIKLLKKKYGATVKDVFAYLDKIKLEYDKLINSGATLEKLKNQKEKIFAELYDISGKLSFLRREIAAKFEKQVIAELIELGMKDARFCADFVPVPKKENAQITANGFDEICFMFSVNLGQPLKPLSEIISGGEMSRFMLGIKTILAGVDNINTLVFDEIDSGISGNIGFVIACKLATISKSHQVISVSHLPQIAAMADSHYLIAKRTQNNDTITTINMLSVDNSLKEIARLSGGKDDSTVTIEHAKELKARCSDFKKSIHNT